MFNLPPYYGHTLLYILTPRLPLLYTIIPPKEWMSSTPQNGYLPWQNSVILPGSLVHICATGLYWNKLSYIIGASHNPQKVCALVTVVPIITYPTKHTTHTTSPPLKRHKLNTSQASHNCQVTPLTLWLFTSHLIESRQPTKIAPKGSHHHFVTIYNAAEDFQQFFSGQFPDHQSGSITYKMELNEFSWAVQWYRKSVADMTSAKEPTADILQKAMPIYHYRGHFYYFGMWIVPIYQSVALNFNHILEPGEVFPFVEACLVPLFF